jgi:hypothetical protein
LYGFRLHSHKTFEYIQSKHHIQSIQHFDWIIFEVLWQVRPETTVKYNVSFMHVDNIPFVVVTVLWQVRPETTVKYNVSFMHVDNIPFVVVTVFYEQNGYWLLEQNGYRLVKIFAQNSPLFECFYLSYVKFLVLLLCLWCSLLETINLQEKCIIIINTSNVHKLFCFLLAALESLLKLWVRTPLMARCTGYNIFW